MRGERDLRAERAGRAFSIAVVQSFAVRSTRQAIGVDVAGSDTGLIWL